MHMLDQKITIRPEAHKDYKSIVSLILRSFQEGTDYSDGTDIIALVEEIRDSKFYIPELSFVAELDNQIVGHFLFSKFPLSPTREGGHDDKTDAGIVMLAPVSVHADYFRRGIGTAMLKMGIEKVRERVSQNGTLYQQLQQMAAQLQKMAAIIDSQNGTNVAAAASAAGQAAGAAGAVGGGRTGAKTSTNSLGGAVGGSDNSLSTQAARRAMDVNNPNK